MAPASHGSTNLEKAPPKRTPEAGFGNETLRLRSAGAGPAPRRPTSHGRTGVPPAIWGTRVSDLPCFYGPAVKNRRAARDPGGPCLGSAVLFTVWRQRIGVPRAIRATRVSDLPRFYGAAAKDRRAARNPGDPAEASPTQGTAPLPHAAPELGRPSELQYIYIYIYIYRSEGRSESTMFCRADGGRVAQITGPSALDGRILDSVASFGGVGTEAHSRR